MPARLTTSDAVNALEANLWRMWSQFGRGDGCVLIDEPGLMRFETPLRNVPYNSIMRFQVDDRVDETIDGVLAAYRARDVPLVWVVHPSAKPSDLDARLRARGLVEAEIVPGMVAPLDVIPRADPVPSGVEIAGVEPDARDPFIDLIAWRYALPAEAAPTLRSIMSAARFGEPGSPNQGWVARRDGDVVAKVVLHLGAGVAGVYGVATKEEARGLGLARTLTIHALDAARAVGFTVGVLHSTPMAVGLYKGLGFEAVAGFRLYSMHALHL